jgi:hypothetical protein
MKCFSVCLLLWIIVASCQNNNNASNNDNNANNNKPAIARTDTVSAIRKEVNPNPVASFSKRIPDKLNDWHFSVSIYETKETFRYLMKLEYMEMREKDTLKIPDVGISPKIEIRAGKEDYSCIIGFYDRENNFREYKQVTAKDGKLSVKVLHHYGVSTYQPSK